MSLFIPARKHDRDAPEMIDNPNADPELLKDELKSIRTVNRLFGGFSAIRMGLLALLDQEKDGAEIRILDLGTGSADLPVYLLSISQELQKRFIITAIDNHPSIVRVARERTLGVANLTIEKANILALQYPPGAFDIVLCSLTLHHFSSEEVVGILQSMKRLCRLGFVVNDLRRSRLAAWLTWIYIHLTTTNVMTLTDSYLSVLRGFTADELRKMALHAGIQSFEIRKRAFFRLLLVGKLN
jgi:ubiquinone/menaquinone biosynthesis C-methylase UbiE